MLVERDDTIIISLTPDEARLLGRVLLKTDSGGDTDLKDFADELYSQLDNEMELPL